MNAWQRIANNARMLLFPAIVMLVGIGWLTIDGLRMKAKQASKYALPSDTSGPSLLAFLRRMDGSGNAPKSILESSNMEPIYKAVTEAYDLLKQNTNGLTEQEQREADYYYLAYSSLAMTQGITPATESAVKALLASSNEYLFQSNSFGTREREIMSRMISLLEGLGRIDEEVKFVESLLGHLKQKPLSDSETTSRAVLTLESVANRLNMMNKVLVLKSTTIDKKPFDIERLRGKVVLVEFWGTRCAPCIQELPALKRIYQTHRDKFEIVGICLTSEPGRVENFIMEHDMTWTQLCDDRSIGWECNQRLAEEFGVLGVPASMLLDPNGTVVKIGVRPLSPNKTLDLEECLQAIYSNREHP